MALVGCLPVGAVAAGGCSGSDGGSSSSSSFEAPQEKCYGHRKLLCCFSAAGPSYSVGYVPWHDTWHSNGMTTCPFAVMAAAASATTSSSIAAVVHAIAIPLCSSWLNSCVAPPSPPPPPPPWPSTSLNGSVKSRCPSTRSHAPSPAASSHYLFRPRHSLPPSGCACRHL